MINVQSIIDEIIRKEGGYVDHKDDHGGPTKYGITLKTLNDFTGRENTKEDVANISKQTARLIYRTNFYRKPGIDRLPLLIIPLILDMAVNHGPKTAIKLLQSELLQQDFYIGLTDGVIGQKTINASERAVEQLGTKLIDNLVTRRVEHCMAIISHDPRQAVFKNGWIARAESFRPEASA
jgi:lysozyme family protein